MSYQNIILYNAVLPSYGSDKKEENIINASDPKNKAEAHKIMFG